MTLDAIARTPFLREKACHQFAQIVHDLRATMLHLSGSDHLKPITRHPGRVCRLTDVSDGMVKKIIA